MLSLYVLQDCNGLSLHKALLANISNTINYSEAAEYKDKLAANET